MVCVAGCASNINDHQKIDQIVSRLVGVPSRELVAKFGEPWDTVHYGEGAKSMSFQSKTKGLAGGQCNITVVVHTSDVYSAKVSASGNSWFSRPLDTCLALIEKLDQP